MLVMMTTSNTQSKWALIGVRVCAVYLALWAIARIALIFLGSVYGSVGWLILMIIPLAILFSLHALKLWQLRSSWRGSAAQIFISMVIISIPLVMRHTDWNSLASVAVSFAPAAMGVIGFVFLNLQAVRALFQNQQSEINNQKSPNA